MSLRLVFLLMFFLLSKLYYCQENINGKYSTTGISQEYYSHYVFQKNGVFSFSSGADVSETNFGKGHYILRNDTLILNYDLTKLNNNSYYKSKTYINSRDSVNLRFNIYNFVNKPLNNVSIYSYPEIKSTASDTTGFAILSLKKENKTSKIIVEGEYLDRLFIEIKPNKNYEFEVFLSKSINLGFNHSKAIKDEIIKFKIIQSKKDSLVLIDNNGKEAKLFKMNR